MKSNMERWHSSHKAKSDYPRPLLRSNNERVHYSPRAYEYSKPSTDRSGGSRYTPQADKENNAPVRYRNLSKYK